ncbi:hypothetical protein C8A01DRAFT_13606 [Parachaetomium inaequale]|uniref:PH domain-containing protein n=1 Tax=Parachaetomium inaequale TaxID=2588326 RepID=A0AAN6SUL0_9PEZI|nr:hypothetical protein C8A01DRAFT_13606 [Parachaetomium inaequale]
MHDLLPPASPGAADLSSSPGSYLRRIPPPDPYTDAGDALRVPLRPENGDKARKRESRLGLRNIFGRGKGGPDADNRPATPRDAPQRLGGIRASLAEINWPYGSQNGQGHRSEITLSSFSKVLPAGQALKHKKSESIVRQQPNFEGIAAWHPPPLFQAYPQAIKHAHLPACTVPAEVVLRMHTHKSSGSLAGLLSPTTPDVPEGAAEEKPRGRHRRNGSGSASRFEWTTKVYVLATSGYLLQYTGAGTFDRLPERVLQLGKDSAAFASDAIPGRHWVLQVSSVAEPDRTPGSQSSLRARLPFRAQERRHSSAFLMVFESAEEMESWISTLRREIETLGGRKVLSETGKPKTGGDDAQLRSQASQRTLVRRDPHRFSGVMMPDQSWSQPISSPTHEDHAREQSFDDTSTSSFISHEGRQLDALRDSYNRLSFISSSQRTMITSVGSSPACSPVRDSFGEFDSMSELPEPEELQPRLRPNAMAIIDRRQSLQTINHVLEMGASAPSLRPLSTFSNSGQSDTGVPFVPQSTPNFSVPHSAGNRLSFARASPGMPPTQVTSSLLSRMSARRPPPSALFINPRPLSLVEDQPSPALSSLSRAGTATEGTGSPLSATPITPPVTLPSPRHAEAESQLTKRIRDESIRDSGISTQDNASDTVLGADQGQSKEPLDGGSKGYNTISSPKLRTLSPQGIPRSSTSLGTYGEFRPGPQAAVKPGMRLRRQSFNSPQQVERGRLLSPPPSIRADVTQRPRTPPFKSMPRSPQHLRLDPQSHTVLQRRSMSHLDGPPPAPPPNRALPPIPQRPRMNFPPPGFI